jgi:hypothetical protein
LDLEFRIGIRIWILKTFQVAMSQVHWAQAECRGVCCSITCRVSSNVDLDLDLIWTWIWIQDLDSDLDSDLDFEKISSGNFLGALSSS